MIVSTVLDQMLAQSDPANLVALAVIYRRLRRRLDRVEEIATE